jgi:hypothetical protein
MEFYLLLAGAIIGTFSVGAGLFKPVVESSKNKTDDKILAAVVKILGPLQRVMAALSNSPKA